MSDNTEKGEKMDYSLLKQLTETAGISGREERVRNLMSEQIAKFKLHGTTDAMGNLVAYKTGKGPRVALVAHMDEVGFMVSKIDHQGFVRVMPVGGVDPQVFHAQKVIVHGEQDLPGVVGSVPPHLRKNKESGAPKAVPIDEGFIDLGLPPKQVQASVSVGDPVTFATRSWENDLSFFGKALDDRIGLFVMIKALELVNEMDCNLVLIASTQEEYGLRGVGPAMFKAKPDIALILEGTIASDTPGLKLPSNVSPTEQGKGPEIRLSDKRMLADRPLADFLVEMAKDKGLAHQLVVKNTGGTDAAAGQLVAEGVIVGAVSVPTRYIHAPISMALKADITQTVNLVRTFLENVSKFDKFVKNRN
ncbi:MAG: M20/M25/M40 family metallo-hydrolase [Desulfobacteraceae bacterium]|jgi:endoglucanase